MIQPHKFSLNASAEQELLLVMGVPYDLIVTAPARAPAEEMRSLASQVMAEYKKDILPMCIDLLDAIESLRPAQRELFLERYQQILRNAETLAMA